MPHKSGYGKDQKMPKKKKGNHDYDGDSGSKKDKGYYRPMDSYHKKGNPHSY